MRSEDRTVAQDRGVVSGITGELLSTGVKSADGGSLNDATSEKQITVGQILSQARTARSQNDLDFISEELCIRPHLLKALEEGDFNKFPSACYATGFLKNYATFLGLNVAQIISQYKEEFNGSTEKVDLVFIEVDNSSNNQLRIISLIILSAIVLYGVWYSTKNTVGLKFSALPEASDVASHILMAAVDDQTTPLINADQKTSPKEKQSAAVQPSENDSDGFQLVQQAKASPIEANAKTTAVVADQVRLSVSDDAWVRVVGENHEILVDRVILAGEEFYMSDRAGLKLMTSNAGAVSIFVGNIEVPPLGQAGEIKENISLDKDNLLTHSASLSP